MNKENCIHLSYACGEEFCLIGKGNKNEYGYYHSYKESLCKGCQSFLSNETMKNLYFKIKNEIIEKGHLNEIEWYNNIPNLKELDKTFFFREYVWVVINSGMKNQVAEKIFKNFWIDNINFNFDAIRHPNKNKAIRRVFNRLDFYFNHLLQSKDKLNFLKNLPHIGDITKYHLAKNLGLNFAKPDRHLVRIANHFEYNNVQKFCKKISELTNDKIGVVDLVFWRFANITKNYLEVIKRESGVSRSDDKEEGGKEN